MNLLTGADVLAEDKLFATLDTRTRRWDLGEGAEALLSDNRRVRQQSAAHAGGQLPGHPGGRPFTPTCCCMWPMPRTSGSFTRSRASTRCSRRSGIEDKPSILLLNKTDRLVDPAIILTLQRNYPEAMAISAHAADGIEQLAVRIRMLMHGAKVKLRLRADFRNGKLMQYLARHAELGEQDWGDTTVEMEAEMAADHAEGLSRFDGDVEVLELR